MNALPHALNALGGNGSAVDHIQQHRILHQKRRCTKLFSIATPPTASLMN